MCLHPVRPHLDVRVVHDNNILAKNIPQVPCDYQRKFHCLLGLECVSWLQPCLCWI